MPTANDPFEEFLRKKKVEMLEKQFREEGQAHPSAEEGEESLEDGWVPSSPGDDDPEREQKLEQEMNEFFEEGGRGGAELFEKAKEIDEERVEEIKDALDDVFEEPPPEPEEGEPFEDEPLTADFPVPGEEEDSSESAPLELESAAPAFPEVDAAQEGGSSDLALADVLTPPQEGEDLRQRVDLLSRLVVKLVERSKLPESEIIEVLIKSGVEF